MTIHSDEVVGNEIVPAAMPIVKEKRKRGFNAPRLASSPPRTTMGRRSRKGIVAENTSTYSLTEAEASGDGNKVWSSHSTHPREPV